MVAQSVASKHETSSPKAKDDRSRRWVATYPPSGLEIGIRPQDVSPTPWPHLHPPEYEQLHQLRRKCLRNGKVLSR